MKSVVNSKRPEPDELLREAIAAIPRNYSQEPFNLEFYSNMTVKDSSKSFYNVETILLTYRKGYVSDAGNWSKILEKRVHGVSPLPPEYNKALKRKYFPYVPGFDIFLVDQLGVGDGSRYTVFNPRKFARMDFAYVGISVFDKDTVAVIEYALRKKDIQNPSEQVDGKYDGIIYVAINNLAIVRHTLKMGKASILDIIYKKAGNNYFPYSIHTERPVYSGRKSYSLVQTVSLRRIGQTNVEVIQNDPRHWYPEDVEFNKQYWDANYPDK